MAKANTPAVQEAANTLPASAIAAFDTHDTGFENVTSRDLLIPRLTILQGLSPQVTQGKPEFDEEARVGEVYDVGLQERFPKGILFLPVYYQKQWLEWAPRSSGKGLQGIHDTDEILSKAEKDEKGRPFLANGNLIIETAQLYGFNISADWRRSFIPMSSTQLKKSKRLLTLATSEKLKRADGSEFTPPIYYRSYRLTTVPESNNEGNWMDWKIERDQALSEYDHWEGRFAEAQAFRESLVRGEARGDLSGAEGEAAATPDENAPM